MTASGATIDSGWLTAESASMTDQPMALLRTKFETILKVRPDDIDMNQHVHASRYSDYVLAARYDQMERCYKMPMDEFARHGFGWFIKTAHIEYKRPLKLGETFVVRTWVDDITSTGVTVKFEILRQTNGKLCSDGYFEYTMINLQNGRAEKIPEWIREKYAI